jgi:hypothetical protein
MGCTFELTCLEVTDCEVKVPLHSCLEITDRWTKYVPLNSCLEITDCEVKVPLHSYVSQSWIGERNTYICLEITDCEVKVLLHSYISQSWIGEWSTYICLEIMDWSKSAFAFMSRNHRLWSKSTFTFIYLAIMDRWMKYIHMSRNHGLWSKSAFAFMSRKHRLWSKSTFTFIYLAIMDRWTKYIHMCRNHGLWSKSAFAFMSRNHGSMNEVRTYVSKSRTVKQKCFCGNRGLSWATQPTLRFTPLAVNISMLSIDCWMTHHTIESVPHYHFPSYLLRRGEHDIACDRRLDSRHRLQWVVWSMKRWQMLDGERRGW